MNKNEMMIVAIIVVIAVVATLGVTFLYQPTMDEVDMAGEAYQLYIGEGQWENVDKDIYFYGNDGKRFQLGAVVKNVPDCTETDGGLDSTYAGKTTATNPETEQAQDLVDDCQSEAVLIETACGKNIDLTDQRNQNSLYEMGYTSAELKNVGLMLTAVCGPTLFSRNAPWNGRCYDREITEDGKAIKGEIFWSDRTCTEDGRQACFKGKSYICNADSWVEWEDCGEAGCDPETGQCKEPGEPLPTPSVHLTFDYDSELVENTGKIADGVLNLQEG
ncbi:hypothetical protein GF345_00940, partial [Candidatus Woesearchaeota archaeon]|nr:hypothetical protein [Candidatus Woesearchaeota archaeon]